MCLLVCLLLYSSRVWCNDLLLFQLLHYQTSDLEEEGAQWEMGEESSDGDESDVEGEQSEGSDDQSAEEVREENVTGAAQDTGGDIEQMALSRKIPLSHQVAGGIGWGGVCAWLVLSLASSVYCTISWQVILCFRLI